MSKFVFWGIPFKNRIVAFNQDLSRYALGETFWQAMGELCRSGTAWAPDTAEDESALPERLRMYHETGVHKVEIFVEEDDRRWSVRCANSRSFVPAASRDEALVKYVETRALTSRVNTGETE